MDASQKTALVTESNPSSPQPKHKVQNLLKMQHKLPTIYEETLPAVKPKNAPIDLDFSKLSLYNHPIQETVKEPDTSPESISDLDLFVSDDEIEHLLENTYCQIKQVFLFYYLLLWQHQQKCITSISTL